MLEASERDRLIHQLKKRLARRWPRATWWVVYFEHLDAIGFYNNYGFSELMHLREVQPRGIKTLIEQRIRIPMRYRRRIGKVAHHFEPVDLTVIRNAKYFDECCQEFDGTVPRQEMAEWMRAFSVDETWRCKACKLGYVSNYANTDYYECYKCVLCGNSYTAN